VKRIAIFTIALSIALTVVACQKAANTLADNKNSVGNANSNSAANTAATPATVAADTSAAGSPTEVYRTAHIARQKKDIETLKKIFAKDILEFFTEMGKADKKSLDDMLREMCEKATPGEAEIRNEKIDGDKATVEYKEEGSWKTMHFVKEDGAWKMTIPKGDPDQDKDDKDNK
jgi:hypothetical protein